MTWILQFQGFITPTFLLFFNNLEVVIEMNVLVVIPLTSWDYNIQHRKKVIDAIIDTLQAFDDMLPIPFTVKYKIYYTASTLKNKEGVVHALNRALSYASGILIVESYYDYVWIVESDIVVPVDSFFQLQDSEADIAFGCAEASYDKNIPSQVEAYKDLVMAGRFVNINSHEENKFLIKNFTRFELEGQSIKGNVFAGLCCVLIRHNVFKSGLRFRWEDRPQSCGHDVYFFYEAQVIHNLNCVLNGNVICEHLR